MWKYAATLSYDGTGFCGWQKQKKSAALGNPSIQATVESALSQMVREPVSVVGSGRTDSGVHAIGQVAHFVLRNKQWEPEVLQRGMNGILPMKIRALKVQPVSLDFHAQRWAIKKQYSYYFQQGPCALPHLEPWSWWIQKKLDVQAMQAAIQSLVGEHDFKPFQASGAKPIPTIRTIFEAEVSLVSELFPFGAGGGAYESFHLVRVRLLGSGFLKQMVRGIAGTLLQVGEGRRAPDCIREILDSQDRKKVGPTAPARALWLERVWYQNT